MDIAHVEEKDLLCSEDIKFTHVVTKVTRGKRFDGTVTLTSNESNNSVDVQGKLKVQLMSIPIGGSISGKFDSTEIDKQTDELQTEEKPEGK